MKILIKFKTGFMTAAESCFCFKIFWWEIFKNKINLWKKIILTVKGHFLPIQLEVAKLQISVLKID